ncbi:MerR family transcriptional regulator [Actinomadura kijaniata]|uniref:MerR family transcriptional regulator n=1 Tax=Actinomadura kijaniata TaxID=46161 RepID=UPI003F1B61F1
MSEAEIGGPGLSVGAAARRIGVAASTLRTWERRYGIAPSRHSAGGHRRYDERDLARLVLMNRLIQEGVPPEEAARAALAAGPGELPAPAGPSGPVRGSRGARLAVPGATPATRALGRAAMAMDAAEIQRIVTGALREHGVERAWQELLAPVLIGIGERHAATGAVIEVEHLLSGCVLGALAGEIALAPPPVTHRPVLLACAPEEQHSLPVHALGAALAREGAAVRVLGARVPYPALAEAVRGLGPAAVFVWSSLPETGDVAPLGGLPRTRPAARLLLGGPGWTGEPPEGAVRVHSLPRALAEIRAVLAL